MTPAPRVSIVTPFLDASSFLQECIESVLAQTYDGWELLLVDDGSSDGSANIARAYAARYPDRIRYFAHADGRNRGASAARNLGAGHARSEYLGFLDADDVYLPRKLEDQVRLLDAHPAIAMVYAATEYWWSWTGLPADAGRDWIWRKFGAPAGIVIPPPRMLVEFLRDGGTVPCMGSVLVRRTALEQVGGWEESFRRNCTDQVFHAKICLHFPVLIADGCWDRYRQHEESSSRRAARAGQARAAFEHYLTWLESYLTSRGVTDPAVWSALRHALRPYRHPRLHRLQRRASSLRTAAGRVLRRTLPLSSLRGRPGADRK
jgi:glycosyltransferase involved in cell wall biosynthesis